LSHQNKYIGRLNWLLKY